MPEATLINVVSQANRCRSVITEHLGFSTVIGLASRAAADLAVLDTRNAVGSHVGRADVVANNG